MIWEEDGEIQRLPASIESPGYMLLINIYLKIIMFQQ